MNAIERGVTMDVEFKDMGEILAIGMGGTYRPETTGDIPALWQQFGAAAPGIPNAVPGRAFGICSFDPASKSCDFTYTAALEVTSIDQVPDGMQSLHITPQRYAVITHKMTSPNIPDDLRKTLDHFFNVWLPQSDYQHAAAPEVEIYDHRFDPVNLTGEFDYCVPVIERTDP